MFCNLKMICFALKQNGCGFGENIDEVPESGKMSAHWLFGANVANNSESLYRSTAFVG
jgi:hypothetical protein